MGSSFTPIRGSLVLHVLANAVAFNTKNHIKHDDLVVQINKWNPPPQVSDDCLSDPLFARLDKEIWMEGLEKSLTSLVKEGKVQHQRKGWCLMAPALPEIARDHLTFSNKNITTAWLTHTLTPEVMNGIRYHVGQRCKKSMVFDEIVDLVDNYLAKLMFRDGLHKYLSEGRVPAISQIKLWAYRAALTQFRDEGRDALTRSFKGAMTERDLADNPVKVLDDGFDNQAVYLTDTGDGMDLMVGSGGLDSLVDVVDSYATSVEEDCNLSDIMDIMRSAIRKKKSRNPDRYARLLDAMASDSSSHSISNLEGISGNRASTLRNDIKESMLEVVSEGREIRKILMEVRDEPYSTLADLKESNLDAESYVPRLIQTGILYSKGGSLCLSKAGSRLLDETSDNIFGSVTLYDAI